MSLLLSDRAGIKEPAWSFQHLGVVWGLPGGGRAALTKMMLGNPVPFPWSRNSEPEHAGECFIVHTWIALGTNWQGCLVRSIAAQAAKLVSSCVLGYAHL